METSNFNFQSKVAVQQGWIRLIEFIVGVEAVICGYLLLNIDQFKKYDIDFVYSVCGFAAIGGLFLCAILLQLLKLECMQKKETMDYKILRVFAYILGILFALMSMMVLVYILGFGSALAG